MSRFTWLGLAVLVIAAAALADITPNGTRHVAHTRLMRVARFVLLVLVVIVACVAL